MPSRPVGARRAQPRRHSPSGTTPDKLCFPSRPSFAMQRIRKHTTPPRPGSPNRPHARGIECDLHARLAKSETRRPKEPQVRAPTSHLYTNPALLRILLINTANLGDLSGRAS